MTAILIYKNPEFLKIVVVFPIVLRNLERFKMLNKILKFYPSFGLNPIFMLIQLRDMMALIAAIAIYTLSISKYCCPIKFFKSSIMAVADIQITVF